MKSILKRFENVFLIVLSFAYLIWRGFARKNIKSPKKILVIQSAKLGDMVCTTPVFRAIKNTYPDAKLYVMGNKINAEVLRGNPDIDKYFIYESNKFWSLLKDIREEKIDFACQTSPIFELFVLMFLSGISRVSTPIIENGYCPWETISYRIVRRLGVLVPHKMGCYAPREYLRLLESINIHTDNTEKHLFFSQKAEEVINNFFQLNNLYSYDMVFAISPAAGNKIKQWPPERFAKVADYIYKKYNAVIIVIGSGKDRSEVLSMLSALNSDTKVINTLDMFNLDDLKCLMSMVHCFVAVDTGPIYIAEAFNTPTIDITGPIDENEQPPIGKKHLVVNIKDRVKPELYVMNAKRYNKKEAERQVMNITVEMVIEKVDEIINILENEK